MTATKTKQAICRVKSADEGIVELVFATFNKIDKDGDVTLKGAFAGNPPVAISAWAHSSWKEGAGQLPYGTGEIRETDTEAVAEVKFLLNTTHGHDAFETVKALSEKGIQEWSYSLEDVVASRGTFERKSVQFLEHITVKEVSPLLRGAGTDTRTLVVKHAKTLASTTRRQLNEAGKERFGGDDRWVYLADYDPEESTAIFEISPDADAEYYVSVTYDAGDDGAELGDEETIVEPVMGYAPKAKFVEHATAVLAAVAGLTTRARDVRALRAEKGKSISDGSRALLDQVAAELKTLEDVIDQPADTDTTTTPADSNPLLELELEMIARRHNTLQGADQ